LNLIVSNGRKADRARHGKLKK